MALTSGRRCFITGLYYDAELPSVDDLEIAAAAAQAAYEEAKAESSAEADSTSESDVTSSSEDSDEVSLQQQALVILDICTAHSG